MKKILALKINNKNLKLFIQSLKKQIKNLKIEKSNKYIRNILESSSSLYNACDLRAKMIANINATNRFEKAKRSTVAIRRYRSMIAAKSRDVIKMTKMTVF